MTRDNFLGYRSRMLEPLPLPPHCEITGPWLANINDAQVIAADIDVSNGVIHVIDRVLLPG